MSDFTGVKVSLDAEAIEREVTRAVLESAIGKKLKEELENLAASWKVESYWNNTLQDILKREAESCIRTAVIERIGPHLKENVERLLTQEFLDQAASKAIASIRFERY